MRIQTLTLPKQSTTSSITIEENESIIILWANWSGKTRLGTRIELKWPQNTNVHRISAQKSLQFPDSSSKVTTFEKAEKDLLFWAETGWPDHRSWHKWHSKPETTLLNDYQKLVDFLFTEHNEEATRYRQDSIASQEKIEPSKVKIDTIKEIWDEILPHRELVIQWNTISTKVKASDATYKASEMSDWERIIFYLIWQCLCAHQDSIIIVDEPELHLHKAVQTPLRNTIENHRKDCVFVYFTHDVDFATNKINAKKIRLKTFDWVQRDWEEYNDIEWIPETLQLELLWARKKVLLIEGEENSYDKELYRKIFPDVLIKSCWGCNKVISYTQSFRENSQFIWMEFYWFIDRDRRNAVEIRNLKDKWIYVLSVAEIENIFLVPELLETLSEILTLDKNEKTKQVIDSVIGFLEEEKEKQITLRVKEEIKYKFNQSELSQSSLWDLEQSFNKAIQNIDFEWIKNHESLLIESLIASKDYKEILKVYNRKSLASRIATVYWLEKKSLENLIIRSLWNETWKSKITDAIKLYIPQELISHIS